MKRLLLLLIISVASACGLSPQEETDVIAAITSGNLDLIRAKLDRGLSPAHEFSLLGFRGYTPLTLSLMKEVPLYEYRNNTVQLKGTKPNAANHIAVYELLASKSKPEQVRALAEELQKAKERKELDLYNAIAAVDLAAVKKAVETGSRLHHFTYLKGKIGLSPLQYAYGKDEKHKQIMEYLISRGADVSVLDGSILAEAVDADVEMVRWLLAHGARDRNGAALAELQALINETNDAAKKQSYQQIIELLKK